MSTVAMSKYREMTGVLKELVRDAVGTSDPISLLEVVAALDRRFTDATKTHGYVWFELAYQGQSFLVDGVSRSWDVRIGEYAYLEEHPRFRSVVERSSRLTSVELVLLFKKVVRVLG
jgi:hypothetical protein